MGKANRKRLDGLTTDEHSEAKLTQGGTGMTWRLGGISLLFYPGIILTIIV